MKQTTLIKLLKFWTLFIGIGAVWGAIMMWIDPSGKMWGMDPLLEMMRAKMPWPDVFFKNLIPSGFALLFVNGFPQFVAYYFIRKNNRLAPYSVLACGIILMLWIALEWWIFGFSWLPDLYFAFGVLEAVTALIYLVKQKNTYGL